RAEVNSVKALQSSDRQSTDQIEYATCTRVNWRGQNGAGARSARVGLLLLLLGLLIVACNPAPSGRSRLSLAELLDGTATPTGTPSVAIAFETRTPDTKLAAKSGTPTGTPTATVEAGNSSMLAAETDRPTNTPTFAPPYLGGSIPRTSTPTRMATPSDTQKA